MHNNCQVLAKHRIWSDDPRTNQVITQKTSPYAQGYNKRLLLVDLICILLGFMQHLEYLGGPMCSSRPSSCMMVWGITRSIVLFLVSIPFFVCETNIVDPIHAGFFCNDSSICYPLKVQSIDNILLTCTGLFISITSITLGEIQWLRCQQLTLPVLGSNIYMAVIYRELSAFLFGVTINQSLTSMAKVFTGRLRPNFLAVCRPALAHLKCTHGYITDYNCTGAPTEVSQARKSFFSDHAAFSAYCVIYLMLYLQARLVWEWSKWLRLMLQTILLPLPLLVGYLKIQDYWQHPLDVLTGFLQGLLTAIWVAFFISDMFLSKKSLPPVSSSCSESQDLGEQTSC